MCAINGFALLNSWYQPSHVKKMNAANRFRGPDKTDWWHDKHISLGHNLLSISGDIETSQQPYVTKKGNVFVYNGEWFDHSGYDTEYLAEMIDYHGIEYLNDINAQFGLAWYDKENCRVTIARDHFGIKPVFYYLKDGKFYFSSSIHGLRECVNIVPDEEQLMKSNKKGFFYEGNFTPYKNIHVLAPGEYITVCLKQVKEIARGSFHDYQLDTINMKDRDVKKLIIEAIEQVGYSKNQIALALSGGLDSTTIASVLRSSDPLCITNKYVWPGLEDQKMDIYSKDFALANRTAEEYGLKMVHAECNHLNHADLENGVAESSLLPLQDFDRQVARFVFCRETKRQGIKVLLTGDGADEIFTGYSGHDRLYEWTDERLVQFIRTRLEEKREDQISFPEHVLGRDIRNNYLFLELFRLVNTYNLTMDAHSGFHGVESRVPFLHQKLVRTMLSIPSEKKLRLMPELDLKLRANTKFYLRSLFKKNLPEHVLTRNQKAGCCLPWNSLFPSRSMQSKREIVQKIRPLLGHHKLI